MLNEKEKGQSKPDIHGAVGGTASEHQSESNSQQFKDSEYNQLPISHVMGLFWCVVQGLTRGAMYSGQKIAHEKTGVKLSHVVLIRSLFIMLGAQIYAWKDGKDTSFRKVIQLEDHLKKSLFWRSFYGYGAIVSAMMAILLCPLSIANSIMMTQVFVSTIAGYLLNKEKLTNWEIFSIFGGFVGVLLLTNEHFFHEAGRQRHNADKLKYHYYYTGISMAILYTLFSALNFYEMRKMGHGIHSSIKTYYFGALCSIGTFIYILATEARKWTTKEFPITLPQVIASLAVGFFSWANQEALSLSLTIVKQGTASAFNNIALIVSFSFDALYFKRQVFIHDLIGAILIGVFAIAQCMLANAAAEQEEKEKMLQLEAVDDPQIKLNTELEVNDGSHDDEDMQESAPFIIKQ